MSTVQVVVVSMLNSLGGTKLFDMLATDKLPMLLNSKRNKTTTPSSLFPQPNPKWCVCMLLKECLDIVQDGMEQLRSVSGCMSTTSGVDTDSLLVAYFSLKKLYWFSLSASRCFFEEGMSGMNAQKTCLNVLFLWQMGNEKACVHRILRAAHCCRFLKFSYCSAGCGIRCPWFFRWRWGHSWWWSDSSTWLWSKLGFLQVSAQYALQVRFLNRWEYIKFRNNFLGWH